jgi:hypothetical protein
MALIPRFLIKGKKPRIPLIKNIREIRGYEIRGYEIRGYAF